jgi:DNA polymerase III subunit beta
MLKIRVERTLFLKAVQIVEKAVSENKIRPVISGIYMEAKGKMIFLRGTDLELTINSLVDGEIEEEGSVVFTYQLVAEYLKEIKDEMITMRVEEGKMIIESKNSFSEFVIYDEQDYPTIKGIEDGIEFYLGKTIFLNLMEKARVASAPTPENLAVNCVRVEIEEKKIKMIASDTYRMMYCEDELLGENSTDKVMKISIPIKTVDSIIKILKGIDGETLNLRYEGNQIFLRIGEISILSRLIDLPFPDYKNILNNTNYSKAVLLNNKDLTAVLKRVLIFVRSNSEAKNSAIFNFIGNKLYIKGVSENAKINEEADTLKDGEDLKISLNVKFLLDYAQIVDEDNLSIKMSSASGAVFLKGEKGNNTVYLTMPLALREE